MIKYIKAVTAVSLLTVLAACGGNAGSSTSAAQATHSSTASANGGRPAGVPAPGQSPEIDRILKQGYIKVGVKPAPPWMSESTSGEWSGISWTLAEAVAKRLGVTLKPVNVGNDTKITSVQLGQLDISITPLNETDARKKVVDFVTYSQDGECWFSLKTDTKVQTVADLNKPGVVDAEVVGGAQVNILPHLYPNLKIFQYVAAPGEVYALQPVETHKADTAGFDYLLAPQIAKAHPELRFIPPVDECLAHPANPIDEGWAIKKGDPVFKAYLDSIAQSMRPQLDKQLLADSATLSH